MTVRLASKHLSTWTILGAAALLVAACTSDGSSSTPAPSTTTPLQQAAQPIPVDPATAQGPGTELGNGFTVADGSVLLAGPLPATPTFFSPEGELVPVEGWAAHLVAAGDPRPVMDAYRVQAEAAGFEVVSGNDGASAERVGTPICRREFGDAVCRMAGYDRDNPDRRFSAMFVRRPEDGYVPATSSLELSYRIEALPDRDRYDPLPEPRAPDPLGDSITPVAPDWPSLPAVGEPFADGYDGGGIEPFLLEPGSRLAGAPGPSGCLNEAYRAILTIDGDSRDVFARYIAQADRYGGPQGQITRSQPTARGPIETYIVGGSGGDTYALSLYDLDDAPPVITIETCTG